MEPGELSGNATLAPADPGAMLGQFRHTFYYIAVEERESDEARTEELLTPEGELIAKVSPSFRKRLDLEGTGRLLSGTVLNVARIVNGVWRYKLSSHPYGLGVGNCPLEPFVSIAVDPARIPIGSRVQIYETIGMALPDGRVHDGIWRAEDIGSAIKEDRIDLFLGQGENARWLTQAGIRHLQPLTVRLVAAPGQSSCVRSRPPEKDGD